MKLIHVTRKRLYGTIMFLVIPLIAACGGGGAGGGPITPPPPATAMGAFIDSPVQGLGYQSGSGTPGTTDANGTFDYTVGETLSFSVGGVVIGTLPDGAPVITPFDFAGATENIARFLQTLDADRDHINGIDLVAAATALADTVQDASIFASDATTFETDITPIIETALGPGAVLIDAATAMANLTAATDSTFEVEEVAGKVFVLEIPEADDIGIINFAPLADPGDTGSTVELFMQADTLAEGGDGTTTVLDWSVDSSGVLTVTDPDDAIGITLTRAGGSMGIISLLISDGVDVLMGRFLVPADGTAEDLSGDSGRTYITIGDTGEGSVTFYPDGILTRIENDTVFEATWILDTNGSLITMSGADDSIALSVVLNGSFAVGGEIVTVSATNLSGDPDALVLQLEDFSIGVVAPFVSPDPGDAVAYAFSTSASGYSFDPVLDAMFAGSSASGNFKYADWVPALRVSSGSSAPGSALYPGSLLELSGSANGSVFGDGFGFALAGNERFVATGLTDFLMFGAGTVETPFTVNGYVLKNVRLFWIEGDTTQEDFLNSDLLPGTLPTQIGRFALDFIPPDDPNGTVSAWFADLSVVAEPAGQ